MGLSGTSPVPPQVGQGLGIPVPPFRGEGVGQGPQGKSGRVPAPDFEVSQSNRVILSQSDL